MERRAVSTKGEDERSALSWIRLICAAATLATPVQFAREPK
jgi:hypothetical protein